MEKRSLTEMYKSFYKELGRDHKLYLVLVLVLCIVPYLVYITVCLLECYSLNDLSKSALKAGKEKPENDDTTAEQ